MNSMRIEPNWKMYAAVSFEKMVSSSSIMLALPLLLAPSTGSQTRSIQVGSCLEKVFSPQMACAAFSYRALRESVVTRVVQSVHRQPSTFERRLTSGKLSLTVSHDLPIRIGGACRSHPATGVRTVETRTASGRRD